jgi:epoxyqueuosine reductase QueG
MKKILTVFTCSVFGLTLTVFGCGAGGPDANDTAPPQTNVLLNQVGDAEACLESCPADPVSGPDRDCVDACLGYEEEPIDPELEACLESCPADPVSGPDRDCVDACFGYEEEPVDPELEACLESCPANPVSGPDRDCVDACFESASDENEG